MDDTLYVATREGLTKMTIDGGEHVWNKSYHFNELLFLEQSPYLAAVDITGKEAFIFDENGSVAEIKTDYGIVSATLNETGFLTLVSENNEEHYIQMYQYNGEPIIKRRTVFKDDGYPINVAMSPNAYKMMTSHLYVSQHMVESVLTFLDFSSVGEEYSDRIVSSKRLKETMASKLHYIDNEHGGVAIGDNLLSFYKVEEIPELQNSIAIKAMIKDYVITDDGVVISFGKALDPEGESSSHRIIKYSKNGDVVASLEFEEEVTGLSSDDETFYVILSSHIKKYKKGSEVWDTRLHKDAIDIYGLSGNQFLVVYEYDYEILKVKDI